MPDDPKLKTVIAAMTVDAIQQTLSSTMLVLSSLLKQGVQHGIITLDECSTLKKDFKTFVKCATLIRLRLNAIYERLLDEPEKLDRPINNKELNDMWDGLDT